jgi:hypothetical protein
MFGERAGREQRGRTSAQSTLEKGDVAVIGSSSDDRMHDPRMIGLLGVQPFLGLYFGSSHIATPIICGPGAQSQASAI